MSTESELSPEQPEIKLVATVIGGKRFYEQSEVERLRNAIWDYASTEITRREQEAEAWYGKTPPNIGEIVLARLEWASGKEVYAVLKYVDEDDCDWRTADDNSEIDYSVHVTHWRRFTNPTPADTPIKTEN